MKKMMFLSVALLSGFSSLAHAQFTCTTEPASNEPTVTLSRHVNGWYEVSYTDKAGMPNRAMYESVSPPISRTIMLEQLLVRTNVGAMPEHLEVLIDGRPTHSPEVEPVRYKLVGLFPGQTLDVLEKNCLEN